MPTITDDLRAAIARAPRSGLPAIRTALYRAIAVGEIDDEDATALGAAIEARSAVAAVTAPPAPRRCVGSRPRTPEALARRRRWAASGRLPPRIAHNYTLSEQAVLALVAAEVAKRGVCTLTTAHIAAVVGVAYSTARAALRHARDAGHITCTHRPRPGTRHDSNILRIVAPEWVAWARLSRRDAAYHGHDERPPGVISAAGTPTSYYTGNDTRSGGASQRAAGDASRTPQGQARRR